MVVIDDLYKKYKQKGKKESEVLAGINLKIPEGERIAIVGENGCGKSTLMKTIAGILTPSSGAVTIDNINVHKHRAKIHHFCSFVFGNRPQLEWDVKLKDSLAFSAYYPSLYIEKQVAFSHGDNLFLYWDIYDNNRNYSNSIHA